MTTSPDEPASPTTMQRILGPLVIVLVLVIGYGIGPTRLPLVGEETCRALHGVEMAENNEWIIATNQGHAILDRPPLQYWTLAVIHGWIHPLDAMTVRVFMVVVTGLMALVVWWYALRILSPPAALLAALAYPTMGHIFDLGRRVETDGLFAMLLAASLLVWHGGYVVNKARALTWVVACIIAAAATLTKGLQGPIAFFGAVYLFLLLRRDWRWLLHWGHVIGVVLFLGAIAAFQIPLFMETGWEGTKQTWLDPGGSRVSAGIGALLKHMAMLPLEVFVATLPWSPLLLGLIDPRFWKSMSPAVRSCMLFQILAIGAIFGPVWIVAEGHHRYLIPMYPLIGVICGVVVHQALALDFTFSLRRFYRDFLRIFASILVLSVLFLAGVTVASRFDLSKWVQTAAQPWWLLVVLLAGAILGWLLIMRRSTLDDRSRGLLAPGLLAVLIAAMFNGPVINMLVHNATDPGADVAAVRTELPDDVELVSFGLLHHKFLYWYGEPIRLLPWPTSLDDVPEDIDYFAITVLRGQKRTLPFEWTEVATLNMDRTRSDDPENRVLVARRVPSSE
jgi:4-amino-4-deoxy-L-arabinose transferase-like glycosyltransferase